MFATDTTRSDIDNEYLILYRTRMQILAEITSPAFRTCSSDGAKSSRSAFQLQLSPLSVVHVDTMVVPLRRLYAWGLPTAEALDCIEQTFHSSGGEGLVEIGAGTGYWACLLRRRGIVVMPYDLHPCHAMEPNGHHKLLGKVRTCDGKQDNPNAPAYVNPPGFTTVECGGPEALEGYASQRASYVLLLCWPPQEGAPHEVRSDVSGMAVTALRAYQGPTIIYVGEVPNIQKVKNGGDHNVWQQTFGYQNSTESGADAGALLQLGATAGLEFHESLNADWIMRREVILPHWPGATDSITVWDRKIVAAESGSADKAAQDECITNSTTYHNNFGRTSGLHLPRTALSATASVVVSSLKFKDKPAEVRAGLIQGMWSMWEEAATAHIVNRVKQGGPRPRPGLERRAVDAVWRRSGSIRRLLLRMM